MITTSSQNISALGSFRKDLPYLPEVDEYSFESFLRMYLTKDNQFYYNIIGASVFFEGELDPSTYYKITVTKKMPWTTVSYNEYRNINLWWLILAVNNITNPVEYPVPGTQLKILYPKFVRYVIDKINERVQ
jgi:hypothetical protein